MAYDPNYKMKHRPPPIARLRKCEYPPPMVGDPDFQPTVKRKVGQTWQQSIWERRCNALYAYAMALKRGVVPNEERRGLWLWR